MITEDLSVFTADFGEEFETGGLSFRGIFFTEHNIVQSGDTLMETAGIYVTAFADSVVDAIAEGDTIARVNDGAEYYVPCTPYRHTTGQVKITLQEDLT